MHTFVSLDQNNMLLVLLISEFIFQTSVVHNNSGYQVQQPAGLQPNMQVPINISGHGGQIDVPGNMLLTQNSSSGIVQGMNNVMIKSEDGDSHFMFGTENNLIQPRNTTGEVPVSPFTSGDPNNPMLDQETSSFGFLGQIPRNFSLSDLTADFSNSTGGFSRPRCPSLTMSNGLFVLTHVYLLV